MNTYQTLTSFFFLCFTLSSPLKAQTFDDFQKGIDTKRWILDTNYWSADSGYLQSQGPNQSSCLTAATIRPCTPLSDSILHRWTFWINLRFTPSSTNYVRLYLKANHPRLDQAKNALFIQIGEVSSQNRIRLFLQTQSGIQLLASDTSLWKQNQLYLRIQVDELYNGHWRLFYEPKGKHPMLHQQTWNLDTVKFLADSLWPYAGLMCRYNTNSRHKSYLFDDIGLDSLPHVTRDSTISPNDRSPNPGELIINEILFESSEQVSEWIEIFNNSNDTLQQSEIALGVYEPSKQNYRYYPLPSGLIPPKSFTVLARHEAQIPLGECINKTNRIDLASWPNLSNEGGRIQLINSDSTLIDQAVFSPKMHYPLLMQSKGVSLERIDYNKPGLDLNNWQSAASPNFSSPGCPNTQTVTENDGSDWLSVSSTVISPNNDGQDDLLSMDINLPISGCRCSIELRDANGRRIRPIVQHEWIGTESRFIWDGLGRDQQRLPAGIYIIEIRLEQVGRRPIYARRCIAVI